MKGPREQINCCQVLTQCEIAVCACILFQGDCKVHGQLFSSFLSLSFVLPISLLNSSQFGRSIWRHIRAQVSASTPSNNASLPKPMLITLQFSRVVPLSSSTRSSASKVIKFQDIEFNAILVLMGNLWLRALQMAKCTFTIIVLQNL